MATRCTWTCHRGSSASKHSEKQQFNDSVHNKRHPHGRRDCLVSPDEAPSTFGVARCTGVECSTRSSSPKLSKPASSSSSSSSVHIISSSAAVVATIALTPSDHFTPATVGRLANNVLRPYSQPWNVHWRAKARNRTSRAYFAQAPLKYNFARQFTESHQRHNGLPYQTEQNATGVFLGVLVRLRTPLQGHKSARRPRLCQGTSQ